MHVVRVLQLSVCHVTESPSQLKLISAFTQSTRGSKHGEGAHHECDDPDEDKERIGGELLFQG
jgi:hypothetical protein